MENTSSSNNNTHKQLMLDRIAKSIYHKDVQKLANYQLAMTQCHDYLMKGIVHLQIQSSPSTTTRGIMDATSNGDNTLPSTTFNNTYTGIELDEVHMCLSNSSIVSLKIGGSQQQQSSKPKEYKISSQQKKKQQSIIEGSKSKCSSASSSGSLEQVGEQAEASLFTNMPSLSNYNNILVSRPVTAAEEDSRFIVVGGVDCTIRVLDYETGEIKASFTKANRQPILALNLFNDKILSASDGVYVIQYQDVKKRLTTTTTAGDENNDEQDSHDDEDGDEPEKVKLTKEEERKREKELKKQYQKKKKPKSDSNKKKSMPVTKPTLSLVKNFRHCNAGLVTSVNIHNKGGGGKRSSLLLITSHSENSVRLWDYESEDLLLIIRGDYCAPIFSSFLSFKGYGKTKRFDVCSINDNFENINIWNPKTHLSYPTVQFHSNTDSTVEDILFRKRSCDLNSSSSNILIPDRVESKQSHHLFLMSIFQFNYSIPFQIEHSNMTSLGRRCSEIGLYEQYVTLEPIHKKEIPPIAELKKYIINSPSSYLLDEVSFLLEKIGWNSSKEIVSNIKDKIEKAQEEPNVVAKLFKLILWYACRVGNSHLSMVFSEIIYSLLSQMKPGDGKDLSFRIISNYNTIIDSGSSSITKPKYIQQKKLSYAFLIANMVRSNWYYFKDVYRNVLDNFVSEFSSSSVSHDPTVLTRLYIYVIYPFMDVDRPSFNLLAHDRKTAQSSIKKFINSMMGNVSPYHSFLLEDVLGVLDSKKPERELSPVVDRDFFKTLHHMVVTFRSNFTKKLVTDNIYNAKEHNILVEKDVVPYLFGVGKKNILKIQQQSGAKIYISGGREQDKNFEPSNTTGSRKKDFHHDGSSNSNKNIQNNNTNKGDKKKKDEHKSTKSTTTGKGGERSSEKQQQHPIKQPFKKTVQYDFSKFSNVNIKGDIKQVDLAIALIDMVINNYFDKNKLNRRNPPITKMIIDHDMHDVVNQYFQFVPYYRLPLSIKFINVKRSSLRIVHQSNAVVESKQTHHTPTTTTTKKLAHYGQQHVTFDSMNNNNGNTTSERDIYLTNEKEVSFFIKKSYSKELLESVLKPLSLVNEFKQDRAISLKLSLGKLFFYQLPEYIERNGDFIPFSKLVRILNREIELTSQEVREIIFGGVDDDHSTSDPSSPPTSKNDFKFSFDDNLSKQHQATITSKLSPSISHSDRILSIEMIDKHSNQFIQLNMDLQTADADQQQTVSVVVGVKFKSIRMLNSPIMNMFYLNLKENTSKCDYLLSASRSAQPIDIQKTYPSLSNFVSLLESQSSQWNLSKIIDFVKEQFSDNETGELYNSFSISNISVKHKFQYGIVVSPQQQGDDDGISSFELLSPLVVENNQSNLKQAQLFVNLTYLQYHCSQHSTVTRYQWKLNVKRKIPKEIEKVEEMDLISLLDFVNILTE